MYRNQLFMPQNPLAQIQAQQMNIPQMPQIQGSSTGAKVLGGATGALGGASTGATLGSMILPGFGTAIGAGLGALFGGLGGAKAGKESGNASDVSNLYEQWQKSRPQDPMAINKQSLMPQNGESLVNGKASLGQILRNNGVVKPIMNSSSGILSSLIGVGRRLA